MEQPSILGYRQLTEGEVALANEGKALAEQVGAYIKTLQNTKGVDLRWAAIGATDIQKGFMALTRAIFQPTTF